ncbi:tripartite tricarboxylate transporter substrate-binding protein, partial [Salmonella enterica]|nr:tripartite tricarboxylate transporter substrate-binding protein [Salmonella enterica]
EAVNAAIGGQVDVVMDASPVIMPHVASGKLRALGVTGLTRSPLAPDVPTIAESGVPGYEMGYWFAAYAPAGTPPDVIKRLNELLVKATQSAPAKQFYAQT